MSIDKWKETLLSKCCTGLDRKRLPDYLDLIKSDFSITSEELTNQLVTTITKLAKECGTRGQASTIYGDLDEKTALYGLFHCIQESDGTLSVSYAIHTLSAEMARTGVQPQIKCELGVQEEGSLGWGSTPRYLTEESGRLREEAVKKLESLNVSVFEVQKDGSLNTETTSSEEIECFPWFRKWGQGLASMISGWSTPEDGKALEAHADDVESDVENGEEAPGEVTRSKKAEITDPVKR